MNPFNFVYTEFLWRPLFNGLVWLYAVIPPHDLGLAIVILTVLIRAILTPLLLRAQKSQRDFARLQGEIKQIQEKFKGHRDAQGKATMELYQREKVNPFSGCLMVLIQGLVLFTLFPLFRQALDPAMLVFLYAFVSNPGPMNTISFGVLDLAQANLYWGALAAVSLYFQTKLGAPALPAASGPNDFSRMLQKQMLYMLPVMIFFFSMSLPVAITLYWTILNILGIVQEILVRKFQIPSAKVQTNSKT